MTFEDKIITSYNLFTDLVEYKKKKLTYNFAYDIIYIYFNIGGM